MNVLATLNKNVSLDDMVLCYFNIRPKLKYKHICNLINERHGAPLAMRRLLQICKTPGLSRQRNIDGGTLYSVLSNELGITSEHTGYRQMTEIISLKYGVNISKEHVRKALVDIDPEGVSMRKKKTIKRRTYETNGPFDVFHIDANDKLKRFGLAIHGRIDGFSRKLIYLLVSTTNNDPLVAANFLKLLQIWAEHQSYCEWTWVQKMFIAKNFKYSYLYAASTRNQRIEAFWSRLKKFNLSWWIDFFSDLRKCRIFNPGSQFHGEALIFIFMPIIQGQLNDFVRIWNTRKIRKFSTSPGGVPEILFNAPSRAGFDEKGYSVDDLDLRVAQDIIGLEQHPICTNNEIHELFKCYINIYKLEVSRDPEDAITFYVKILECLEQDGFQI